MRLLEIDLWRCFFRLFAAVVTRNVEAFNHVASDIEAWHARKDAALEPPEETR